MARDFDDEAIRRKWAAEDLINARKRDAKERTYVVQPRHRRAGEACPAQTAGPYLARRVGW
jgi:hypothetical protein